MTDAQKQIHKTPDYTDNPYALAYELGGTPVTITEGVEVHIYFEDYSKIYVMKRAKGWRIY